MTIICATHDAANTCTWIGSDSRTTFGGQSFDHTKKWRQVGEGRFVGYCGYARAAHLLDRNLAKLMDIHGIRDLADALGTMMRDDFWRPKATPGEPDCWDAGFIIATRDGVWGVSNDLTLFEVPAGHLWADGSGERFALGAAHVLQSLVEPSEVVRGAIEAAKAFDTGCGGETFVHRIG